MRTAGKAGQVEYNNANSDLFAETVQAAIDELAGHPATITNSAENMTIRAMSAGEKIRALKIIVTTPFTAGITATLGFPADNDELIAAGEIDLQTAGIYEYVYDRLSEIAETLTMYFSAADSSGQLTMYIK